MVSAAQSLMNTVISICYAYILLCVCVVCVFERERVTDLQNVFSFCMFSSSSLQHYLSAVN